MYEYIFTIGCFHKFNEGDISLLKMMKDQSKKIIIGLQNNEMSAKLKNTINIIDSYDIRKKNLEMYADDIFMVDVRYPEKSIEEYILIHFDDNIQPITIGSSKSNNKVIKNNYKGELFFIHDYKDTFRYEYCDNTIIITRTDQDSGWGQHLLGYKKNWCFITGDNNKNFVSMNYVKSIMPIKYLEDSTQISATTITNNNVGFSEQKNLENSKKQTDNDMNTQKEIPKIIYICHKSIECLEFTYNNWKNLNPLYEIRLFDDALCEKFLIEEFSELHQTIFKFIPDGPIKSDFWRICIIYKYGGIYVDADIHPLVPLNTFLLHDSDLVTCITKHNQNFNPHFIASRKNNPIFKECIEEYIKLYKERRYKYWHWSIVNVFNRQLSNVKHYHNKMPTSQVFTLDNQKYQLFFEEYDNKKKLFFIIHRPHGYYCSFLNKHIFNTRYTNYNPYDHSFKNDNFKNHLSFFKITLKY